jgi:hypothetical protein
MKTRTFVDYVSGSRSRKLEILNIYKRNRNFSAMMKTK